MKPGNKKSGGNRAMACFTVIFFILGFFLLIAFGLSFFNCILHAYYVGPCYLFMGGFILGIIFLSIGIIFLIVINKSIKRNKHFLI